MNKTTKAILYGIALTIAHVPRNAIYSHQQVNADFFLFLLTSQV